MDKRIIKTRSAIFKAVFDLATEKELNEITVIELCERANINKSTFYLHYKSIDDCLAKCTYFFTDSILKITKNLSYDIIADDPAPFVTGVLDIVENNMNFILCFKNSKVYDSAIRGLKERFVESISKNNKFDIQNNYHQIVKITFMVGGCIDAITQPLPEYNRQELEKIMIETIKRKPGIDN